MAKRASDNGEPKVELGFLVTIEQQNGSMHPYGPYNVFRVRVVEVPEYGKIEHLRSYHELADLEIRDQQSVDYPALDGGKVSMNADVTTVTRAVAHTYLRILTKVENGLEREYRKRGAYPDFAEQLVRIALILGVKKIIRATPESMNGYPYAHYSLGDGATWIRAKAYEWTEKYAKKEVTTCAE